METVLRFHGREITTRDVASIRDVIEASPGASRRALSFRICEAWSWAQPNGALCDVVCRSLMLELHRAGHIELPPPKWTAKRPRRHVVVEDIELPPAPVSCSLAELGPLDIRYVRASDDERLVKTLVQKHHYLGYVHAVGERVKYLVRARGKPIACFCWSSAPRHLGPRDRYIGWTCDQRKKYVRFIAYQSRFLILPWVHVPHLASHLLGAISRRLSDDWQRVYAHPIFFTETFVDPNRFRGTCYRAANWTLLGITTGRGKNDQTGRPNRSLKQVYGYPLVKDFRRRLAEGK